ncbi:MAG: class I SAM-dependent methyltransferase [Campylobacterota bacterium]|nr:class I SAM-dependent methyltransferase [Campylobacterota bacterium]
MSDYLNVVYSEENTPYTDYPKQLAKYLFDAFEMKRNHKMLEIGCGRGEMLRNFKELGLDVKGIDLSPKAPEFNKDIDIKVGNVEEEKLPYEDNSFDIVYSKSVLEHFYYPERYIKEVYRVLKPKGLILTLVPDWEANYKTYFDDYTHRTPFTSVSLNDILEIHNFKDVNVYKFRQLPLLWKYPFLNYFSAAISPFIPVRTKIKFLRWSRELMLISSARK